MATKTRKYEPKRKAAKFRDTSPSPAQQVAESLLASFPNGATQTLAKRAYRENGALWPTLNACKLMFRRLRGQHGTRNRNRTTTREHFRPASECMGFEKLPEGIVHLEDWKAEQVDTPGTWLVMSDLHIPYHDAQAIRVIWREAKRRGISGILLNGDLMDCFAVSRWEKDPRKRNFKSEIATGQKFFEAQDEAFPGVRKLWKFGNHCERYDIYMQLKAPELLGIPEFDFAEITDANKYGVATVRDKRPVKLGKLWTLHGHEYKFNISNPVNPARGIYLRSKVSTLVGHLHQSSSHTEPGLDGHVVTCWSTGCLCDMHPDYSPINKWNLGFAIVTVASDGAFEVENYRIIDGKIWH